MTEHNRRVRSRNKPTSTAAGSRSTTTSMSHRKSVLENTVTNETLDEDVFPPGVEPAFVRVGVGNTYNLGDFNSLRIDVAVTLPCLPSQVEEAYSRASEFCVEKMREEEILWMGER